jgi:hypothetical protein
MNSNALFVETVRAMESLPASLREHTDKVTDLGEHRLDKSYIEFLDTQIRLSPRGPEWTERLKRRRAALLPFIGVTLLYGRVQTTQADFTVEINPETRVVVHWEQYVPADTKIRDIPLD